MSENNTSGFDPRKIACRVAGIEDVSPGVRIISLEPENKERLDFKAGQYALVKFGTFEAKPLSIASTPKSPLLEFHVKSTGHGATHYATAALKPDEKVELVAPFGDAFYRANSRPILAVAGGLGIAPLKAIIEAALESEEQTPIHLYLGVCHRAEFYLERHFSSLAKQHPRLKVTPVVSEPGLGTPQTRTGLVAPAALNDFQSLENFEIYLAGPVEMILQAIPLMLDKGAKLEHVHSDAFQVVNKNSFKMRRQS